MKSALPVIDAIRKRFQLLSRRMNERQIREFAGVEAKVYGRGGIAAVALATGLAINTVRRGLADLDEPADEASSRRIRKFGGGRKPLKEKDPGLVVAL